MLGFDSINLVVCGGLILVGCLSMRGESVKDRIGERIGWTGGWTGGFIWVLILSIVFFLQKRTELGILGMVLVVTSVFVIFYFSPWHFASTHY